MAEIPVNGTLVDYPDVGDVDWGTNATNFAILTSAALGKIGLASGTSVDITSTLDVTGATTLDSTLTVAGTATLNGNTNLGNASSDTTAITGILNVDSGVLYVNPTTNKVGINDTTPSVELDVNGSVAITGNETIGGTLGVTGDVAVNTNKFNVTASSGNTTIAGTLGVTGDATLTGKLLNSNGSVSSPSISFSSDSDNGLYYIGTNNYGISVGGNKIGEFNSNGIQALNNYVLVVDEKSAGTQGGTFTSGAMRTRDLNTTKVNRITGYSLSSNQITLPAGMYKIHALVPSFDIQGNLAKLRNITDSSDVLFSNSGWTTTTGNNTNVVIIGEFTISAQKTFEIQHECITSGIVDGFGTANNIGVCIYTQLEIWKIA